jgi:hypothetical protein
MGRNNFFSHDYAVHCGNGDEANGSEQDIFIATTRTEKLDYIR